MKETLLMLVKNNEERIFSYVHHTYTPRYEISHGYRIPKLIHGSEIKNSFYLARILYRIYLHL